MSLIRPFHNIQYDAVYDRVHSYANEKGTTYISQMSRVRRLEGRFRLSKRLRNWSPVLRKVLALLKVSTRMVSALPTMA